MNEIYLHYLWNTMRIPLEALVTTTGMPISIIQSGTYNENENGPDFFNARIELDNLKWNGNIELHVKSSDWYLHKHQFDQAYDNVILHVVYHHDQEVIINNQAIPTLELKNFIDQKHYANFTNFYKVQSQLLCQNSINDIDPIFIYSMMDKSIINRLNRKIEPFNSFSDEQEVLYRLVGQAFGMKANKLAFNELTTRLPFPILRKCSAKQKMAMVELTSGLAAPNPLNTEDRFWMKQVQSEKVSVMNQVSWKKSGFRHHSAPQKRVEEFAKFIAYFDFEQNLLHMEPVEVVTLFKELVKDKLQGSDFLSATILINAVVPYFYWKSTKLKDAKLLDHCIDLLELIPAENNAIVSTWKRCNVYPKNSYESQALIELYNEFCRYKKCLSCAIGNKVLNR